MRQIRINEVENITQFQLLSAIVSYLESSGVAYAILGDTSRLQEIIYSDVDILVPTNSIKKINECLIYLSDKYQFNILNIIQHQSGWFYTIRWLGDSEFLTLGLDFCQDISSGRMLLCHGAPILESRVYSKVHQLATPNNSFQFSSYLFKKIKKNSVSNEQLGYLKELVNSSDFNLLNVNLPIKRSLLLPFIDMLKTKRESDHELMTSFRRLKMEMPINFSYKARYFCKETIRMKNRILTPNGLCVAILGPDGSGKTTLINTFRQKWGLVFRGVEVFHLLPRISFKLTKGDVENKEANTFTVQNKPHEQRPRNIFFSILKLVYFLIYYNFGFLSQVYPRKIRTNLVMFDRYFHDLLIDPIRYRQSEPQFITRLFSYAIPEPDVWLVMNSSPDVIQARKREVSDEECKRQCIAYLQLSKNLKNAYVIDASAPAEHVLLEAENLVCALLHKRSLLMLGKK